MTENPVIRIYVNQIKNRIIFRIKTGYYLEIWTPKMMKLFGNTKSKVTNDENGDNAPHVEITEVVLVHCTTYSQRFSARFKSLVYICPQ